MTSRFRYSHRYLTLSTLVFLGLGMFILVAGPLTGRALAASLSADAGIPPAPATVYKTEVINNGHWVTICRYTDAALKQRVCGTSLRVTDHNNANRLLLVLSAFRNGQGKLQGVLVVPTGVMIAPGTSIVIDGAETKLSFTACEPADCVAAVSLDQAMINRLKKVTNGAVKFTLQNNQVVTVSFPMDGFDQALPYL